MTGRSDGAPERLRMVITREIPGKPRETLTSTTLEPANSVSQPLPRADKDAYVDLKLHRDDGSTLPSMVFTHLNAGWRADRRPEPVGIATCLQPASATPRKHLSPSVTTVASWR